MTEIIKVIDPQNDFLERTPKEQQIIDYYYKREWTRAAANSICQGEITSDFFRYAKDSADILYAYLQDGSIRGFAFVNTINYDNDPSEPLENWYLNLICISPDIKPRTRATANNSKKPSGKLLIEKIQEDAAQDSKGLKLRAIDTVITYYNKLGFKLSREDGKIIEHVDEKLSSLLAIQKQLNLFKLKKISLTPEEKTKLETDKLKIITSGRFMSAIPDYFTTLNKQGKEDTIELINEGFYMLAPKIQTFLSKSKVIKDSDSSLIELIHSKIEKTNHVNNLPGTKKKYKKKQSKKKQNKQSKNKQSKKKQNKQSKKKQKKQNKRNR